MNIKCVVMYDGTNYSGFQRQPVSITIQGVIEKVLEKIYKESINITVAGRTDKGVHAIANVFNYHCSDIVPIEKIPVALNSLLPADIFIKTADLVSDDFHSRYSAVSRTYEYRICYGEYSPFLRNYRLFIREKPDINKMILASEYLVGTYDFHAFRSSSCCAKNSIRTIYSLAIEDNKENREIIITIKANAFLKNMVRVIVGTLLDAGYSKIKPEYLKNILDSKNRKLAGKTISPYGLFLKGIEYPL